MIEYIQLLLLIILVDRNLIIRNRHKLAFEYKPYYSNHYGDSTPYYAIWIYCKKAQSDYYTRDGGTRLIYFGGKNIPHKEK